MAVWWENRWLLLLPTKLYLDPSEKRAKIKTEEKYFSYVLNEITFIPIWIFAPKKSTLRWL